MFIRLSIILVNNVILDKQQIITEEKESNNKIPRL